MIVKYTRTREVIETITISGKDQAEIDQKFDKSVFNYSDWVIENENTINLDIEDLETKD